MALHFLDDGIIAGDLAAVALSLNLAKCELVVLGPVAPSALSSCLPGALLQQEDGSSRVLQHFEFLGAAIGDDSFVEAHTTKRVAEASKLFDALAALVRPHRHPPRAGTGESAVKQTARALGSAIDGAAWDAELLAASQTERATLFSEAGAAARAFLAAPPAGKTRMEPAIFLAELRARLGTPEAASEIRCPLCDGVLDVQGHHAAMCVAGGERNQRRNAVRDVVCAWAERAGLYPEKESPASSFTSVRMTHALPSGDQPTSIFRPWPGLQSPLTSLSRRPSDRTPWRRLLGRRRRPLSATPDTRKPTSTRRKPSEGRKRYEEQDRYEESDGLRRSLTARETVNASKVDTNQQMMLTLMNSVIHLLQQQQGQSGQSSGSNQATTQVAPAPQQTAPPPQNTVSETEFRHLQEQNELLREANEQLQSRQTRKRALIETILLCEDKDDEAMEEAVETFLKGPRQKAEGDQLDSGKPSDDGSLTEPKKSEPQVPLTKRQEWFKRLKEAKSVQKAEKAEKKKKKGKTPDNQWWTNCDTPAKNQEFGDWQDWGDASSSPWHQKGASVDNSCSAGTVK
eukprot:s6269_g4.t1